MADAVDYHEGERPPAPPRRGPCRHCAQPMALAASAMPIGTALIDYRRAMRRPPTSSRSRSPSASRLRHSASRRARHRAAGPPRARGARARGARAAGAQRRSTSPSGPSRRCSSGPPIRIRPRSLAAVALAASALCALLSARERPDAGEDDRGRARHARGGHGRDRQRAALVRPPAAVTATARIGRMVRRRCPPPPSTRSPASRSHARRWFEGALGEPTPAQTQGWPPIAAGEHVLVCAPTGSGKTLAAFLWFLDRAHDGARRGPARALRLAAQGAQLRRRAQPARAARGHPRDARPPRASSCPRPSVAVRTGDTPPEERRRMLRTPPDILITTPESLYLMLTSRAREMLTGIEAVIVDEVHAVAATKRGAHLALSLERLAALCERDPQRVALSATQRPLEEIARFVGGDREMRIVDAGMRKELDLRIEMPADPERGRARRPARLRAGRERRRLALALARALPGAARARADAPLDDRLRQQPPHGRAARAAPQRAGRGADRARPPRLALARGARRGRGGAQGGHAAVHRRDVVARARHRHGRRRPRRPGLLARLGRERPAARRPRRPQRRHAVARAHLPALPRRARRGRRRRARHARGRGRAHARAAHPARRAVPADRRDGLGRGAADRLAARARQARLSLPRAHARAARERARPARRALPVGRVRRAAPAHRLGAHDGRAARTRGRPAHRDRERRHDPRPRPLRRLPRRRRRARRRARRGDGARGARGPGLPAGRLGLAHRADRARSRDRLPRARPAGAGAVLEGRAGRAARSSSGAPSGACSASSRRSTTRARCSG